MFVAMADWPSMKLARKTALYFIFSVGWAWKTFLFYFFFISRNWPESLFVDAQENVNAGTAKDGTVSRSSEEKRD
jgi:hypothetical protein